MFLTPAESIEKVIASIMETENLPREAAAAGAQRYAMDEANDLADRAKEHAAAGRYDFSDKLNGLAREYRNLANTVR
jgi:hypothetical protein